MSPPRPGLYESIITEALAAELEPLAEELIDYEDLHAAEAGDRIALHLARLIERSVDTVPERNRIEAAVEIARKVVDLLDERVPKAGTRIEAPQPPGRHLRAVRDRNPDGTPRSVTSPDIPLLDTTLLTNAPGEPRVGHQIQTEINSADRIDLVMAFIRRTGINQLVESLRRHCEAGRGLRVLTTTYTNSTESAALERLVDLGADVRVSYDLTGTRLHAKAWLFHRDSGFSTAYVGSSNLTHQAQQTGLEWNVRLSEARNRAVLEKMTAVFESYWSSGDFVPFDSEQFAQHSQLVRAAGESEVYLPPTDIRLEPFQERLLESIELARGQGRHSNLLVSATGTGKTVMAAVDYSRLKERLSQSRLLFVAHRDEILTQSIMTFRHALRDASFGEKWVGGERPREWSHVFASIQSINALGLTDLDPRHFDVVIVDEFHHAAADSYASLLNHLKPVELLGLTATPERADGLPVLDWFGGRISAELRLWDAVDQHRLSPFEYFGIHDGMDFRGVKWTRGRGYDVDGMSRLLTADDAWANRVIRQVAEHVPDISDMRALGFCVSVDHARFMARKFNDAGIQATAVWGNSSMDDRRSALNDLRERRVNVVFSVDLFNEGVDLPTVDTLLMLRPTESPTLFLQQLGRGLRKAPDKNACLVLDFIGLHRSEYRFDRKYRALLGGTRKGLEESIGEGFPYLPAGCHMELDRMAREVVLRSIRESLPSRWPEKVAELELMRTSGEELSILNFLEQTGLELSDIYSGGNGKNSWSDLLVASGAAVRSPGPHEAVLRAAVSRLLHMDDEERLDFAQATLRQAEPPAVGSMAERERRLLRMLAVSLASSAFGKGLNKEASLQDTVNLLWRHPAVLAEVSELCGLLRDEIDHLHPAVELDAAVPLSVHSRYSRIEIQAAIGDGDHAAVPTWREGVRWMDEASADVFVFTLDKTTSGFSPTTRYRDYAISRELIHWESQSRTNSSSPTGIRYQEHVQRGSSVHLFARLNATDRAFWYLGPATYVSHVGEMPMQVTWKLQAPLPGDLFAQFAAAVA